MFLFALFMFSAASCNKQKQSESKDRPVESPSQSAAQMKTPSSMSAYILPLREAVFVNGNKALFFPGNIAGSTGEGSYPMLTEDAGESWSKMQPETINFDVVTFPNPGLGWAVTQDSKLWKTVDGGTTWTLVSELEFEVFGHSPEQILFTDEFEGWLLYVVALFHTQDGGRTWRRDEFPSVIVQMSFQDRSTGWICGGLRPGGKPNVVKPNVVYRTTDGGRRWEEIEIPGTNATSDDIRDLFFVDEKKGWLSNGRGIYRTEDGGVTWHKLQLPEGVELDELGPIRGLVIASIHFMNGQEGWAAGASIISFEESEAVLLHTTDGGDSWQRVETGIKGRRFSKVFVADDDKGWLVGETVVFEDKKDKTDIYRTTDRGKTWEEVLTLKSPYAHSQSGRR
ncbi:MAG TPA: YCF48-related protein [Blastocatellia bacterium]|nr:YCF48-related protein [Blastocatellia bacterium]